MRLEDPPFERGKTFYDGATPDASNLGGDFYLGKEYEFEDMNWSGTAGVKTLRTGRMVRVRVVRNTSGTTLLPKRLARYSTTEGEFGKNIDGYTTTTAADFAGVIDEWLPSTGVVDDDLCYIVVEGPTNCLTDIAGDADNVFSVGDKVVALTAATSQCTTAGRVDAQDLTGATALLADQVQNCLGVALSAKATANTNASILVDMYRRY